MKKIKGNELEFTKMSGAGNDFIVIDNFAGKVKLSKKEITALCTPRFAIGADGVLLLERPTKKTYDFTMTYYNADGSKADMCGNGARCISRFSFLHGYAKQELSFLAGDGGHCARVEKNGMVKLSMSEPYDIKLNMTIKINGKAYKGAYINTGVPHFVVEVKELATIKVNTLGRSLRFHKDFGAKGTNVNFVEKKNGVWHIRTYERGVEGETLACGTGAVAAGFVINMTKKDKSPVVIKARGGVLKIYFKNTAGKINNVFLEGNARIIAEGVIKPEAYKF